MKKTAEESFIKSFKIEVIENGIDLNSFKPSTTNLDKYGVDGSKKIILGVASGWDDRKGLNDFLELASVVDDSIQIVLVGLSKKQKRKIPKKIIAITRTDSKNELAALYSTATVFFNPTYEDNYPTVNLEALACGTRVVTYNVGGSPEIINKTNCGFVINKRDFKELIRIVNLPYEKNRILRVADSISNTLMIRKHLDFYKSLLN